MQSFKQPPPVFTPSIFEAIKQDDWEGLIAIYAVAAYDAIHAQDLPGPGRRSSFSLQMGHHQPSPSSLMAAMIDAGGPNRGQWFRDGKRNSM